jgi:hypothetical protein
MHTRRFFLLAVLAAFLAVALHLTALTQFGRGLAHRARAVTASEAERIAAKTEATHYSQIGTAVLFTGVALAVASVVLAIVSSRRHEPARRSVVFGLLLCYLLLQLVLV